MDLARLTVGLFLPWIAGFIWLRAAENRLSRGNPANVFRQLGYGFFLGYAGLQGLVLLNAWLAGPVGFWPISSVIVFLAILGAWLNRRSVTTQADATTITQAWHTMPLSSKVLFFTLLLLIGVHLWLSALEIFNRPVYPWDAWLLWLYRAKAWYFSGTVYELAPASEWLLDVASSPYTVDAYRYPTFASIIPFWAALSLGHWSETLVNTPVLLCGTALGLGLFGQCRETGLGPVPSLAAAYFLLSLPLLGTHLSLAGYADIWMAGFAGLGFVSLLRGSIQHSAFAVVLGLLMIAIGVAVKNEGMVWLYTALAFMVLWVVTWRTVITIITLALILACLGWLTGTTSLDLPGLGRLGFEDERIYIPLVGSYALQYYPVWSSYLAAFLRHDSWNLLWYLVIAITLASPFIKPASTRKAVLLFIGLFAASQLAIFAITEQGLWAVIFTAINRLPLHVAPTLVFTVVLALIGTVTQQLGSREAHSTDPATTHRFRATFPAVMAALALILGLAITLAAHVNNTAAGARVFAGDSMRVVLGAGRKTEDLLEISEYKNGAAIVSTGSIVLDADQFDMLELQVYNDNSNLAPRFFWRTASLPDLQMVPLYREQRYLLLDNLPDWSGRVTEAGIAFFGDEENHAGVAKLTFSSKTFKSLVQKILDDWTAVLPWTIKSTDYSLLGPETQQVRLSTLALVWLLMALLLGYVFSRGEKPTPSAVTILVLIAWALPDAIWLNNRIGRLEDTFRLADEAGKVAHIDVGIDKAIAGLIASGKNQLDHFPGARVLVVAESERNKLEALRAKYQLLPYAAVVTDLQTAKAALGRADALLFIPDSGQVESRAKAGLSPADIARQRLGRDLSEIAGSSHASLLQSGHNPSSINTRQDK
jgi:hypothetical protein